MLCINISGFKKLNGSKVEKRDIDYILNEVKSSIQKNQEKNSIIHIINSSFILDNKKQNRIPLGKNGDHLGLHMTFITLTTNKIKNIKSIFNDTGLKIERVIRGGFNTYMKSIGKFGGQNKIPKLSNDRTIADKLYAIGLVK